MRRPGMKFRKNVKSLFLELFFDELSFGESFRDASRFLIPVSKEMLLASMVRGFTFAIFLTGTTDPIYLNAERNWENSKSLKIVLENFL